MIYLTTQGTISIDAGKLIKAAIRSRKKTLVAFCHENGFSYNMFTQWLGGFKKDPNSKHYEESILKLLGIDDLKTWVEKYEQQKDSL